MPTIECDESRSTCSAAWIERFLPILSPSRGCNDDHWVFGWPNSLFRLPSFGFPTVKCLLAFRSIISIGKATRTNYLYILLPHFQRITFKGYVAIVLSNLISTTNIIFNISVHWYHIIKQRINIEELNQSWKNKDKSKYKSGINVNIIVKFFNNLYRKIATEISYRHLPRIISFVKNITYRTYPCRLHSSRKYITLMRISCTKIRKSSRESREQKKDDST